MSWVTGCPPGPICAPGSHFSCIFHDFEPKSNPKRTPKTDYRYSLLQRKAPKQNWRALRPVFLKKKMASAPPCISYSSVAASAGRVPGFFLLLIVRSWSSSLARRYTGLPARRDPPHCRRPPADCWLAGWAVLTFVVGFLRSTRLLLCLRRRSPQSKKYRAERSPFFFVEFWSKSKYPYSAKMSSHFAYFSEDFRYILVDFRYI